MESKGCTVISHHCYQIPSFSQRQYVFHLRIMKMWGKLFNGKVNGSALPSSLVSILLTVESVTFESGKHIRQCWGDLLEYGIIKFTYLIVKYCTTFYLSLITIFLSFIIHINHFINNSFFDKIKKQYTFYCFSYLRIYGDRLLLY